MSQPVQPIYILPEGSQRSQGRTAQQNNILAAKLIAQTVRTTLGPKGMDKMLVDSAGQVTVTNDGVTILEEMQIQHPAGKMVVEVARTQEDEVGDGTTTAVVLAGELLTQAERLLSDKLHPTVIIKGFQEAQRAALEELNKLAEKIDVTDTSKLKRIAQTAMTGKGAESHKELLAELTVQAIKAVTHDGDVDKNAIKIEQVVGGTIQDSEYIEGIVLDKERMHPGMPELLENASILLTDSPLEVKETESDAKINISNPEHLQAFLDMEERMLDDISKHFLELGVNVVVCQKGVDDMVAYKLAKAGVLAVRRVKKSDMEKLAKATGATILSNIKDATRKDLGKAGRVGEYRVGDQNLIFIERCRGARAVTILIRGGTEHVISEVTRAVTDAVGDLRAAVIEGLIVPGAGAIEMQLSRRLLKRAKSMSGREQLAFKAFAESLEVIPRTLAENAGLDPIDVMADLRSAHAQVSSAGIDVYTGRLKDSWRQGVIEPLRIKTQALSSATDVATMILRIDDVIAASPVDADLMGDLQ